MLHLPICLCVCPSEKKKKKKKLSFLPNYLRGTENANALTYNFLELCIAQPRIMLHYYLLIMIWSKFLNTE